MHLGFVMQKGNWLRVMSLGFRSLWSVLFTCLIGVFKFCSRDSLLQKGFEHAHGPAFCIICWIFFFADDTVYTVV